MTTNTAIIIGVWIFAAATALSRDVAGWFMVVAIIAAIIVSTLLS